MGGRRGHIAASWAEEGGEMGISWVAGGAGMGRGHIVARAVWRAWAAGKCPVARAWIRLAGY